LKQNATEVGKKVCPPPLQSSEFLGSDWSPPCNLNGSAIPKGFSMTYQTCISSSNEQPTSGMRPQTHPGEFPKRRPPGAVSDAIVYIPACFAVVMALTRPRGFAPLLRAWEDKCTSKLAPSLAIISPRHPRSIRLVASAPPPPRRSPGSVVSPGSPSRRAAVLLCLVLSPSLILIDHGHFQFNGVHWERRSNSFSLPNRSTDCFVCIWRR